MKAKFMSQPFLLWGGNLECKLFNNKKKLKEFKILQDITGTRLDVFAVSRIIRAVNISSNKRYSMIEYEVSP